MHLGYQCDQPEQTGSINDFFPRSDIMIMREQATGNATVPSQRQEAPPVIISPLITRGWARVLLYLLARGAVTIVFSVFAAIILMATGHIAITAGSITSTELTMASSVVHGLMILLLTMAFRIWIDRRSIVSLGFSLQTPFNRHLIGGTVWGAVLISLIFGMLVLSGGVTVVDAVLPWLSLLAYLFVFIVIAIVEECSVRGYMLANLMASMNKYAAVFVSAAVFTLFHAFNPNVWGYGLVNLFLAGLLLGIYCVHHRNLWFPIGLHFTWNYFQGNCYGSKVSGLEIPGIFTIDLTGSPLWTGGEFGFEGSMLTSVVLILFTVGIHLRYRNAPIVNDATFPRQEPATPAIGSGT
jgi:uncharacterized protein